MGRFGRVLATLAILVGGLLALFSLVDLTARGTGVGIELRDVLSLMLGLFCLVLGISAFRRRG
jgi:hypothetical protein